MLISLHNIVPSEMIKKHKLTEPWRAERVDWLICKVIDVLLTLIYIILHQKQQH